MMVRVLNKYMDWEPVKSSVIKDQDLAEEIHYTGYKKVKCLNTEHIAALKGIYEKEHQLNPSNGGMFYSMYSKDKAYRKRIHTNIQQILAPVFEKHFQKYKNVVNTFVVKLPGEKSEFYLHQDTTSLDEFKHSPLSLWIPLQNVDESNGTIALIEKTHWFFSPFRGVSFSFPFRKINQSIKKYLKPIQLELGEVLFFDNRLVHNSLPNFSEGARIAIVCGIFPESAELQSCYKRKEAGSPIEIFSHKENYLLEYPNFFYNCTDRPVSGKLIKKIEQAFPEMSEQEFEELCLINKIPIHNSVKNTEVNTDNCELIAEPDGINRFTEDDPEIRFWIKLKKAFQKILSPNM